MSIQLVRRLSTRGSLTLALVCLAFAASASLEAQAAFTLVPAAFVAQQQPAAAPQPHSEPAVSGEMDGETVLGDLNCDGALSHDDIEAFVLGAREPQRWCTRFGRAPNNLLARGDFTGDGHIDEHDVKPFCKAIRPHLPRSREMGGGDADPPLICDEQPWTNDLWLDSDNNNGTSCPGPNPGVLEDTLAKRIAPNLDDDDGNNVPDALDLHEVLGEEGELVPAVFKLQRLAFDPIQCDIFWGSFEPWEGCGEQLPESGGLPRILFNIIPASLPFPVRIWRSPTRGELGSDEVPLGEWYGCGEITFANDFIITDGDTLGDMNCDGAVDNEDLDPFVLALTNSVAYSQQYPECDIMRADLNFDCLIDNEDVDYFIALLAEPSIYGNTDFLWLWIEGIRPSGGPITLEVQLQYCVCEWLVGHIEPTKDHLLIDVGSCTVVQYRPRFQDLEEVDLFGTGVPCCGPECPGCTECLTGLIPSRCHGFAHMALGDGTARLQENTTQQPLNLAMSVGFGPGDYPPRDLKPELSSLPLVSRAVSDNPLSRYLERPTLGKELDLITGVPLHQDIDFELPFGGATFRHVRTFSESLAGMVFPFNPSGVEVSGTTFPGEQFWDWNGTYWMMSENPILLIDASYPGILHKWNDCQGGCPQLCYFIPDAHHSVPFLKQEDGTYVCAVDWIDAQLTTSGGSKPEFFTVSLYNGTIRYRFAAVYEDLWTYVDYDSSPPCVRDVHEPSPNGPGIPYYGLLQSITDAYGNRMECEYVTPRTHPTAFYQGDNCRACAQDCNAKGQLKTVKLYAAGEGTATWTLVYTHRTFGEAKCETGQPPIYSAYEPGDRSHFVSRALHSIHV